MFWRKSNPWSARQCDTAWPVSSSERATQSGTIAPQAAALGQPKRRFWRRPVPLSLLLVCLLCSAVLAADAAYYTAFYGPIEHEERTDFSHIRIRRKGQIRAMIFVRDTGDEVVESYLNLRTPHELISGYTRYMFLSYAFKPQPRKVLIVGLGGGAMVHFLRHHDPELQIDVVEIDPAVVRLAESHFGVKNEGDKAQEAGEPQEAGKAQGGGEVKGDKQASEPNVGKVNIITADALDYLTKGEPRYDVIYMDAFLKPSADTDSTGVPLRLKTTEFYKQIQTHALKPDGLLMFNVNPHPGARDDVATIASAFEQVYTFVLPESNGYVVAATRQASRTGYAQLLKESRQLDRRFKAGFSFERLAERLSR